MPSEIGAQLFTLRDFLRTTEDIRVTLKKVRELGYSAVQLSGYGAGTPQEIADFAGEAGVAIVATHVSYDRIRDDVEAVVAEHRLWNCRHVGIGGMPADYRNAEGFARFAAEASRTARPLIDAGLTFSYHNHSFELERFGDRTGLEILAGESDPEVFSFEVDTYWDPARRREPGFLVAATGRAHAPGTPEGHGDERFPPVVRRGRQGQPGMGADPGCMQGNRNRILPRRAGPMPARPFREPGDQP